MATWTNDTFTDYTALRGFQIPWPRVFGPKYNHPGDAVPAMDTEANCGDHIVEAFYDGPTYLQRLYDELENLHSSNETNRIVWIHGWYFQMKAHNCQVELAGRQDMPTILQTWESNNTWRENHDGIGVELLDNNQQIANITEILDLLHHDNANPSDIRIIPWLNPWVVKSQQIFNAAGNFAERNLSSIVDMGKMIDDLNITTDRVAMNVLTHPLGGAHAKFVIIGSSGRFKAFVGGVDIAASRNNATWHDATVLVSGGDAPKFIAEFFRDLWNEITTTPAINVTVKGYVNNNLDFDQTIPSHSGVRISIPQEVTNHVQVPGDKYVQVYKTLPRKRYHYGKLRSGSIRTVLSFLNLPVVGQRVVPRTVSDQMRGLSNDAAVAITELPGIYSEPISFAPNGRFEFKVAVYKAIAAATEYIFIMDQDLSNFELAKAINKRIKECTNAGLALKVILATKTMERITVTNPPAQPGGQPTTSIRNVVCDKQIKVHDHLTKGLTNAQKSQIVWLFRGSHAKIMLIDDVWMSVGSANCMRRSFYTDIELGVCIMHPTWVLEQRRAIWAGLSTDKVPTNFPTDLAHGLRMFEPNWPSTITNQPVHTLDAALTFVTDLSPGNRDARRPPFSYIKRRTEDPDSNDLI